MTIMPRANVRLGPKDSQYSHPKLCLIQTSLNKIPQTNLICVFYSEMIYIGN